MKDQLSIARDGIEVAIASGVFIDKPVRRALLDSLTAIDQIEAAVGQEEPVAWLYRWKGRTTSEQVCRARWPESDLWIEVPLYEAPPAQQPQYEAGDMASAHNDGFRAGVASVAQQPQSEAVPPDVVRDAEGQ